jgi:hypothetical protein
VSSQQEHERQLVLSFIIPARQSRYLELLGNPKRRKDITRTFCHFKHVDMRYAAELPPRHRLAPEILKLLKSKGAPDSCYALSESDDLDGKETPLADALSFIVGRGIGTFLSCIPGKLAYFEDEDNRWILERKAKSL